MRVEFCLLAACLCGPAAAAENVLTPEEKSGGWTLLFDGATFAGWRDPQRLTPPGDAWTITDGCLKTVVAPKVREDLFTAEPYTDFELKFDWRISKGGNSGVKYRVQRVVYVDEAARKIDRTMPVAVSRGLKDGRSPEEQRRSGDGVTGHTLGFEFQLYDDPSATKKLDPASGTGALYQMIAPTAKPAHPAGEWNRSMIHVKGDRVEHWINGVKALEGSLAYEGAVRAGIEKRWGKFPALLEVFAQARPSGPIALQHHLTEVWFRNLKVRRLK